MPFFRDHIFCGIKLCFLLSAVKEDMQVVGVRVEDTENRLKWKAVIRCGNPCKGTSRKENKKKTECFFVKTATWCF